MVPRLLTSQDLEEELMRFKNALGSFVLASLFALPSIGCMVRGSGSAYVSGPSVAVIEVEEEPPPPRVMVVQSRPGHIWIEGRWERRGRSWHWHDGRYERERVGYGWQQGRWERRGRGHVWVDGRWSAGARERREDRREERQERREDRRDHRGRGPVVRDHR